MKKKQVSWTNVTQYVKYGLETHYVKYGLETTRQT